MDIPISSDELSKQCASVTVVRDGNRTVIREPVFQKERIIILGGGHIAMHIFFIIFTFPLVCNVMILLLFSINKSFLDNL